MKQERPAGTSIGMKDATGMTICCMAVAGLALLSFASGLSPEATENSAQITSRLGQLPVEFSGLVAVASPSSSSCTQERLSCIAPHMLSATAVIEVLNTA